METKRWMKRFVIFKFIQEFTLVFLQIISSLKM